MKKFFLLVVLLLFFSLGAVRNSNQSSSQQNRRYSSEQIWQLRPRRSAGNRVQPHVLANLPLNINRYRLVPANISVRLFALLAS